MDFCFRFLLSLARPKMSQYVLLTFLMLLGVLGTVPVEAQIIANSSFETPSVGTAGQQYNPTGAIWTFLGDSGIQSNGSGWTAPNAPDGTQTAFLNGNPNRGTGNLGNISQSVNFTTTGTYVVSFQAAQRSGQVQPLKLTVDSVQVGGLLTPSGSTFGLVTSGVFTISTTGLHTITLSATAITSDLTTMVDAVTVNSTNFINGSFETPSAGSQGIVFTPANASWIFTGDSGIQSNGGFITPPNAPDGSQTAFIECYPNGTPVGTMSQTLYFPTAGSYAVNFQASRWRGTIQPLQLSVDGAAVGSPLTPPASGFGTLTSAAFTISTTGLHRISFAGTVNSGNQLTLVDQVSLAPVTTSLFTNGSFETPSVGSSHVYSPSGGSWLFGGDSGIEADYTAWGAPSPFDGSQAAFLNGNPTRTAVNLGNISQSINFPTPGNSYVISFQAAQCYGQLQPIKVTLDGVQIGGLLMPPSTGEYSPFSSAVFTINTAGSHTIDLSATATTSDLTSVVDYVVLVALPLPAPASLSAMAGNNQVTLNWPDSYGATGYNIYRGSSSGGEGTAPINSSPVVSPGYTDTGLAAGTPYYYTVKAVNGTSIGLVTPEATATPLSSFGLLNSSFEIPAFTPVSGTKKIIYDPANAIWAFTGLSGIQTNGGTWYDGTTPNAPNGTQVAFLQGKPSLPLGTISQNVYFPSVGTYVVSFYAAQRQTQVQPLQMSVDGVPVGNQLTPSSNNFSQLSSIPFSITTTGLHMITLSATVTGTSGELTTLIDQVAIAPLVSNLTLSPTSVVGGGASVGTVTLSGPALPGGTVVSLSSNSTSASVPATVTVAAGSSAATFPITTTTTAAVATVTAVTLGTPIQASLTIQSANIPGSASLSATANSGYVNLQWNAVANAVSYNVYRSTTSGGEGGTPIATNIPGGSGSLTASYPDGYNGGLNNLPSGTYYYQVTAVANGGGEGLKSNEASAICSSTYYQTILPAPQVKVVAGSTQATLTWSAVPGAVSYNVYRSVGNLTSFILYQTGSSATTLTDTGLTTNSQYTYYVCAVNVNGQGSPSYNVTAIPGSVILPATSLSATANSGYVNLQWNAVANAVTYNVYRSTTSGGEGAAPIATNITGGSGSLMASYADGYNGGLANLPSGTYYYQVTAVANGGGEGLKSNEASAICSSTYYQTILPAPQVKVVAGSTQATLTWSAVPGAVSYNVYRSVGNLTSFILYQTGSSATTLTDTGLTTNSQYTYYVCAVNVNGQGSPSYNVTAIPGSVILPATSLSATANSGYVNLQWNAVANAVTYNVYRSTTSGGEGAAPIATNITGGSGSLMASYADGYNGGLANLPSGTYYYQVTAVSSGGEGLKSNEASASPSTTYYQTILPAPVLTGTLLTYGGVTLNWSSVSGATGGYNLYRTLTGTAMTTLVAVGLTSTTYTDTTAGPGTFYYYVCAVNTAGQGAQSTSLSLTPNDFSLLVTPNSVTVGVGSTGVGDIAIGRSGTLNSTAVNLSLSGTLPSGVTASFFPQSPDHTGSSIYFCVGAGTTPGTYNLTLTGSVPGSPTSPLTYSIPLTLVVTSP